MHEMNKILHSEKIPEQWTAGQLVRLYKGKGKKGKCSNERGITLASNIGKLFERLINNRITTEVNMTDAQAGGIKGRATVDHLLILKELVHISKMQKQEAILTYLDVTKAYDKAWLDAVMYTIASLVRASLVRFRLIPRSNLVPRFFSLQTAYYDQHHKLAFFP